MEVERLAEIPDLLLRRSVEIEPEEVAPPRSKLAEERRLGLDLARAVRIDQMARHSTIVAPEPDSGSGYAELVTSSINLLTIRGIRIGINWSWLVIFGLIVWTLATAVFPNRNEGLSDGTYLAMALVAAGFFFLSLLAHELGHAFQAQHEGMEIDGITLWLFGGVAKFKGMFRSAGAEFRIAIAGPLVSLAIGLGCALVAWAFDLPDVVDGVVAWLGYINLLLLVFNLLPALPLDGGRVLRSALWKAKGSFGWATTVSANIGRGIGVLMIGAGVFMLIFREQYGGAWFILIGWFLVSAASSELRYLTVRNAFGELRVRDVMTREPLTARPDMTLRELANEVIAFGYHSAYPVVRNGLAAGLVSRERVASTPRDAWDSVRVSDLMVPLDRAILLREDTLAVDAAAEIADDDGGPALVVADGRLLGVVSLADVARVLDVRLPPKPAV